MILCRLLLLHLFEGHILERNKWVLNIISDAKYTYYKVVFKKKNLNYWEILILR